MRCLLASILNLFWWFVGGKLEEMEFERPDIIRGKRGIHASRKGGRTTFVRWGMSLSKRSALNAATKREAVRNEEDVGSSEIVVVVL